jgi:hypothetical protein
VASTVPTAPSSGRSCSGSHIRPSQ